MSMFKWICLNSRTSSSEGKFLTRTLTSFVTLLYHGKMEVTTDVAAWSKRSKTCKDDKVN